VVYCFVTLMLEYAGGDRYALLHGPRHGVLAGHWLLCFAVTVKRPLPPREVSSPRALVPSFLPSLHSACVEKIEVLVSPRLMRVCIMYVPRPCVCHSNCADCRMLVLASCVSRLATSEATVSLLLVPAAGSQQYLPAKVGAALSL
jgi:hypothetical protein